jgi:hypothetical protein
MFPALAAGLDLEAVVADSMVKEGAQLIVDGFEIGRRIGLSFGVRQPRIAFCQSITSLAVISDNLPFSKIRQDFLLDDALFCQPGVQSFSLGFISFS